MTKGNEKNTDYGFETKSIHAGSMENNVGALVTPIYQTSTFSYPSTGAAAEDFEDLTTGFAYSRITNPSTEVVERKMSELEHGARGVAFGSGMGAISATLFTLLASGDHLVCAKSLYSGTDEVITDILSKFGVESTYTDLSDSNNLEEAIQDNTKLVYFETPPNPTMDLIDIEEVVKVAKKHDILVVIDNTFSSPYITNPIDFGVDVVIHSATKYLGGHGDIVAGIVVCKELEMANEIRITGLMHLGAVMAPNTAFLLERGIKTLGVRMERHSANALALAQWLEKQDWVETVRYPFLESDPCYEIAKKQMRLGGGMISLEVKNGVQGGENFMNNLKLSTIAVSLGDPETLVEHPASMTHSMISEEGRLEAGITNGQIRISVGLETVEDLIADMDQAAQHIYDL